MRGRVSRRQTQPGGLPMRSTMKSSARKLWKALFFQKDFHTPLTTTKAESYTQPLEIVQLASSPTSA